MTHPYPDVHPWIQWPLQSGSKTVFWSPHPVDYWPWWRDPPSPQARDAPPPESWRWSQSREWQDFRRAEPWAHSIKPGCERRRCGRVQDQKTSSMPASSWSRSTDPSGTRCPTVRLAGAKYREQTDETSSDFTAEIFSR